MSDNPYVPPAAAAHVDRAPADDLRHLQLLSVFHYVLGAIMAMCSFFPSIYIAVGIAFVSGAIPEKRGDPELELFGWIFIVFASAAMLMGWALSAAIIWAGRRLTQRRGWLFCAIVAGLMCVFFIPFGTVLGVFTLIVLLRPSVKELFERREYEPRA